MRELRLWAAAAAAPAVAAGFSLLAGMRRRRSLHPVGAGYRGWFVVDEEHPDRQDVPLFQPGRAATAVLRFSRAAGLPEPLPDAFGVAVKLPDVYGPGADQDLLLTSSIDRPLLRRLLFPATSFLRGAYSSALPYELGGGRRRIVLLLVPKVPDGDRLPESVGRRHGSALAELAAATAAGLQFQLRTAGSFGPSQPLATLTIGSPLSTEETARLRFNPWTTGPGIRPSGWINLLRDTAYRASQRAGTHTARRSPAHQTAAPKP
ncbi:MAG TPA: hypothetical protein VF468_06335 [Actinomycetota bacterium]|nr:hypothetical protein [Actinomycetota bacterium]